MRSTLNTIRVSKLLSWDVKNKEGESLGKIVDLVIDHVSAECRYAVLETGGLLTINGKYFAVPITALQPNYAHEYILLELEKAYFDNAEGFDKNNWPDAPNLILNKHN